MLLSAFSFDCDSLGKRTPREASLTSPATRTRLALPTSEGLCVAHSSCAGSASEPGARTQKGSETHQSIQYPQVGPRLEGKRDK